MRAAEKKALHLVEGGLELLRNAISKGDPHNELELRANDLLREVRAIGAPRARPTPAPRQLDMRMGRLLQALAEGGEVQVHLLPERGWTPAALVRRGWAEWVRGSPRSDAATALKITDLGRAEAARADR
jgi:hypothetical protein